MCAVAALPQSGSTSVDIKPCKSCVIGKTREQQQRPRQQRRERAAELAIIGLTHKQIAERLRVARSTVAALLAEGRQQRP